MTHTRIPGRTLPSWPQAAQLPETSALTRDTEADVCVVGAGIAGLSTAYFSARAGRSVVVLEKGVVGSGNTGRTTAHLANALDDRYSELLRLHGEAKARLVAHSHTSAISLIEGVAHEEKIDCDFERLSGYLFAAPGDEQLLDEELEAAQRVGLEGVERVPSAPLGGLRPCLHFPEQASSTRSATS